MGSPVDPVSSALGNVSAVSVQAQLDATQGVLSQASGSGQVNMQSTIGSLQNFEKNYPAVYNAFMLAFANDVRSQMQRSEERLEEEMKKQRQS